jgi:hypothetical protein
VRGTEVTEATVRVSREFSRERGAETTASIDLQKFDPTRRPDQPFVHYQAECPPECFIPSSAFKANDASHARFDVTLRLPEVASVPPQLRDVVFHLVWRGEGPRTKQRTVSPDGRTRTTASARQAVATGTITDGTSSFVEGRSDSADIESITTRARGDRDDEEDDDD